MIKRIIKELYDEDYYEHGIETGKSCYQNYRWIPSKTLPFCMAFIDHLELTRGMRILDFGCGKGFIVKGLRWLHRQAWGVENSTYCLTNLDPEVGELVFRDLPKNMFFDWIISKDVFEHISHEEISDLLRKLSFKGDKMFCVIPLADNNEYRAPNYEMDSSHIIRENEDWWGQVFVSNGWEVTDFCHRVKGMKENYAEHYPIANGYWKLKSM